jgi:hypothetical protein
VKLREDFFQVGTEGAQCGEGDGEHGLFVFYRSVRHFRLSFRVQITGTFGTEIKVTPSCRPNRNLWSNFFSKFDILFEEGAQMNALEKKERNPAWNLPVYRP